MRKLLPFLLVAAAFVVVSCAEETPGKKLDNAIDAGKDKPADVQKKVEEGTK